MRTISRKDSRMNKEQQWLNRVPVEWGHYIAGFVDGEGSFNASLRKKPDHKMGWQVVLTFNVSQRESYVLAQIKKYLGCGRLQTRKDGVHYYVCANPISLKERVIPFFKRFPFRSARKKRNFSLFCQIADLMFEKQHLNEQGLERIIALRESLNQGKGRKRKYSIDDWKTHKSENPQRLYARPRIFRKEKGG